MLEPVGRSSINMLNKRYGKLTSYNLTKFTFFMVDVAVPWRLRRPIMLLHDYSTTFLQNDE
jgi:hypothetical protein